MNLSPIRTQNPTSFADQSGHALIDIQLLAHGLQEVSLIADPQHFPPSTVSRIASMASRLFGEHLLAAIPSREEGPWAIAGPSMTKPEPGCRQLAPAPAWHPQRLLISLIKRPDRVEVEPAFSSIDPGQLSAEAIDGLIAQLEACLNAPQELSRPFVSGQN